MIYRIIIPAYNGVATLPELIERIRHAAPGVGIFVVDDGSTDRTADLLTKM